MIISRTAVDTALMNTLANAYAFTTMSFMWQDWSNTGNQPALYIRRGKETVRQDRRGLNVYILNYEIWIYAQVNYTDNSIDPYSTVINPILDAVDNALSADVPGSGTDYQNLGLPQVGNSHIDGTIFVCDGSLDGQAIISFDYLVYMGS